MTDSPDTPVEEKSPQPVKPRVKIDKDGLKEKASKTWRGVWTVIGGLATIGGVIGLYQFMASSPAAQSNSTESLLVAMVAEGVISEDQAGNLSKLLSENSDQQGEERADAVKSALEDQDKDALIAMAKTYDEDTREEGLDMLEAAAETSEDWLTIAQVSYGTDSQRSLDAAEKAVQLDRDNFRALTFLVQAQAKSGDYDRARRSAESARMLARTPLDRLMAEQSALSVSISGYNKPQIENNLERLEKAISVYKPVLEAAAFDQELALDDIDSHPSWIMGFTKQLQASAAHSLEKYEDARTASNESTEYFNALRPIMPEQNPEKLLQREISNLNLIGRSYYEEEDFVKAAEIYLEAVSLREELVSLGADNAEYQLALSLTYAASAEHRNDNTEIELGYYRRALELFEDLLVRDPESEDLKELIEWTKRAIKSHDAILTGDGNQADIYMESYKQAKSKLLTAPDDKELQDDFFNYFRTLTGIYGSDWDVYESDFKAILKDVNAFAKQLEDINGPRLFTYELQYTTAHFMGAFEQEQDNISAARINFENMLHFSDLLAAAPDVSDFDVKERGYRVEVFKLSALYKLAMLDDAQALDSARSGLRLAEAWDASGQLLTREQQMLQLFKDRIEELEAED